MRCFALAGGLVLVVGTVTAGQPIPAGMKVGLPEYLRFGYQGIKQNLLRAAEKLPEADYGFRPGSMPEVRTYGQIFAHVAEGQFDACAAVKGVPNPNAGRQLERELHTKREFLEALRASFAFCDDVFAALSDADADAMVPRGEGHLSKLAMLVGVLAHASEMYGISTVYLRARHIVPPSSE